MKSLFLRTVKSAPAAGAMPDKWYDTSARSSCDGVSLRWVAGAVDDTLIHVLSGAIEVTARRRRSEGGGASAEAERATGLEKAEAGRRRSD